MAGVSRGKPTGRAIATSGSGAMAVSARVGGSTPDGAEDMTEKPSGANPARRRSAAGTKITSPATMRSGKTSCSPVSRLTSGTPGGISGKYHLP